jgi:hypothetical protein
MHVSARADSRRSRFAPVTGTALLRSLGLAILIAGGSTQDAFAQRSLKPVDQAVKRPDFFSFRAQLMVAVARRDTAALLDSLDKNIKNSFGDNNGIEAFRQIWEPDSRQSRLWETLGETLALGGSFDREGAFTAPYVFSRWPEEVDAFTHAAIVAADVRARVTAKASAPTVATLSFTIVEQAESQAADESTVQIRLPGGKAAFVDRRFIRSPVDYRAVFTKTDGKWRMTAFLAGD